MVRGDAFTTASGEAGISRAGAGSGSGGAGAAGSLLHALVEDATAGGNPLSRVDATLSVTAAGDDTGSSTGATGSGAGGSDFSTTDGGGGTAATTG